MSDISIDLYENADPILDTDLEEIYQPTSGGIRREKKATSLEKKTYYQGTLPTDIAQNASDITTLDGEVVKKTGAQTIAGVKTFSDSPIIPSPTTDFQASTKKYVDDKFSAYDSGWFVPVDWTAALENIDHSLGLSFFEIDIKIYAKNVEYGEQDISGVGIYVGSSTQYAAIPKPVDSNNIGIFTGDSGVPILTLTGKWTNVQSGTTPQMRVIIRKA